MTAPKPQERRLRSPSQALVGPRHTLLGLELWPPLPQNPHVEDLTPMSQNVTVFGDRAFKDVIKLETRPVSLGPDVIRCPHKKGTIERTDIRDAHR